MQWFYTVTYGLLKLTFVRSKNRTHLWFMQGIVTWLTPFFASRIHFYFFLHTQQSHEREIFRWPNFEVPQWALTLTSRSGEMCDQLGLVPWCAKISSGGVFSWNDSFWLTSSVVASFALCLWMKLQPVLHTVCPKFDSDSVSGRSGDSPSMGECTDDIGRYVLEAHCLGELPVPGQFHLQVHLGSGISNISPLEAFFLRRGKPLSVKHSHVPALRSESGFSVWELSHNSKCTNFLGRARRSRGGLVDGVVSASSLLLSWRTPPPP